MLTQYFFYTLFSAPVQNLTAELLNGQYLSVSWSPLTELKGWNVSYYSLTYSAFLSTKDRPEASFITRVDQGRTSESIDASRLTMREGVRHVIEVVAVLEVEGVEGIGEVRGQKAAVSISLEYGKTCMYFGDSVMSFYQ